MYLGVCLCEAASQSAASVGFRATRPRSLQEMLPLQSPPLGALTVQLALNACVSLERVSQRDGPLACFLFVY